MKKSAAILLILIFSISLVSAGFWGELWEKIIGKEDGSLEGKLATLPIGKTYCDALYDLIELGFLANCSSKNYEKRADIDNSGLIDYGDLSYFAPNQNNETWCVKELLKEDDVCEGGGNGNGGNGSGTQEMTLDRILNMCFELSEEECNQYKIDFVKSIVDTYTDYHNNYDSLISKYNQDVLYIQWDNNLTIGGILGDFHRAPLYYPYSENILNNSQHEEISTEFKNKHLILRYDVHGYPRLAGMGLIVEDIDSVSSRIYTTNEEYINFSFKEGSPALFVDSNTCGSEILWDPGGTFCCQPQARLISKAWVYIDNDGASYVMQNFRRYFASEGTIGKSLLKTSRRHWYFHGDITAHVPYKTNLTPECGWAEKQGIDCICNPDKSKNKLAVVIKEGGIYDNLDLINSITSFLSSVESDIVISGSLEKFPGNTFEELDSFIESLYYDLDVAYVIFIGEDLPYTQLHSGTGGVNLYGGQELGIINNSRISIGRWEYCYDVAISYILPPLSPTFCRPGEIRCFNGTRKVCSSDGDVWLTIIGTCQESINQTISQEETIEKNEPITSQESKKEGIIKRVINWFRKLFS